MVLVAILPKNNPKNNNEWYFFTVSISFVLKAKFSLVIWINIYDIDLIWNSIQLEHLQQPWSWGLTLHEMEINTQFNLSK